MAATHTSTALQLPPPVMDTRPPFTPSPELCSSPASPIEISQQLQRVDALHQQLKAETARAQEFLSKLRRGELEAQSHVQSQFNAQSQAAQQHQSETSRQKKKAKTSKLDVHHGTESHHSTMSSPNDPDFKCTCQHPCPLPASTSETKAHKSAGNHGFSMPLRSQVDEREVRDLEKRVRGLEGRVRGFEGLPPDREMALLEVERLRRELESLARRREGLFEGLSGDLLASAGMKKPARPTAGAKAGSKVTNGSKAGGNSKISRPGKK